MSGGTALKYSKGSAPQFSINTAPRPPPPKGGHLQPRRPLPPTVSCSPNTLLHCAESRRSGEAPVLLGRGWADPLQALAGPKERPVPGQQPGAADSLFPDSELCPGPASDRSPLGLLSGPWEVCASCDSPSGVTTLTLVQANLPSCRADSGLCGPFAFSAGFATQTFLWYQWPGACAET